MRAILHMGTLRGQGSATVGQNLLAEFVRDGRAHNYEAWIPAEWPSQAVPLSDRLRVHRMRSGSAAKLLAENFTLRRALARDRSQRLFALGDTTLPLCRVPNLLLVQQPLLAYQPAEWDFDPRGSFAWKLRAMAAYFRAGARDVSLFTVQTEDMRQRLAARWTLPLDRIRWVPSAVRAVWHRLSATNLSQHTGLGRPYIVYPASPIPYKNHAVLPRLMASLPKCHRDLVCRLTLRREDAPALAREATSLGVLDRFRFDGRVPNEELPTLLAGAVAAVIPSLLESFGLPYYEALAAGCPVVAADRPFAREALGDVGLYAEPLRGESYAEVISRLLDSNDLRFDVGQRGRDRFRRIAWTWERVAAAYVRLLEAL